MKVLKKMLEKIKSLKKRTKIILGIVLILVIIIGFFVFKPAKPVYETGKVLRSDVIQEVSANGTVEAIDEIDLKFKTSGTIESISVQTSQKVKKGAVLARLESGELYSQYLQTQATYNQAKAKLNQLIAGATSEEIKVAEQVLENAEISLNDARSKAEIDLNKDYSSALIYLISASNKCNKALTDLDDMQKTYFYDSGAISKSFLEKKAQAEELFYGVFTLNLKGAQELIETAVDSSTHDNIDLALAKTWTALQKTSDVLEYTKTAMSDPSIRSNVSTTDKATINADATDIDSSFSNINTAQTNISDQKITNQININSAQSTYNKAKVDLDKLKAVPRNVDIAVYQADVERYQANVLEYSQKLRDASIIAPFDGQVAKIDGKIGEVITAGAKSVITLLSPNAFKLEADIPETDIGDVSASDPTTITLDAFPEKTYTGQILEIDPAETLIDGVVYYKIAVLFPDAANELRSGMSGDVVIQAEKKESVLNVPQRAVVIKNGDRFARILEDGKIKDVKVITGLRGSRGEIEIISGLIEGETIITYLKKS